MTIEQLQIKSLDMDQCYHASRLAGSRSNYDLQAQQSTAQMWGFFPVQHFWLSPKTNAHLTVALSWIYRSWRLADSLCVSSDPLVNLPHCC